MIGDLHIIGVLVGASIICCGTQWFDTLVPAYSGCTGRIAIVVTVAAAAYVSIGIQSPSP